VTATSLLRHCDLNDLW